MYSIHAILSLIATISAFGIGSFVFFKSSRGHLHQVFFLFMIALGILSLSQFQMRIATNFNEAFLWSKIFAIWPIVTALSAHFVLSLDQNRNRSLLFIPLLYAPGIIISYLQLTTNLIALPPVEKDWGWVMVYNYGVLHNIAVIYGISFWLITVITPFVYFRKFKGNLKKQALLIFIGYTINFAVTVSTDFLSKYFTTDIPELGSTADIITLSLVSYSIWKYDMFSVASDSLSKKLFASISEYIFLIDEHKRIIEINDSLLHKLDFSREEVLGKKVDSILDFTSNDNNPIQGYITQLSDFQNKLIAFKSKQNEVQLLSFSASLIKLGSSQHKGQLYVGKELIETTITDLKEKEKQIEFLSQTAIDLMQINHEDDINEYAVNKIYNLREKNAIVICSEFQGDINNNKWEIKYINGINKRVLEINRILGFDISKMKASSNKKYLSTIKEGKLTPFEFDVENLTNGFISKEKGETVKRFIGLKEMHVIAVSRGKDVFGTITIISNKNTPKINPELIESFMAIVSMECKRQYINSELQKSESLFKTIIENSQIHIFLVNQNGTLLLAEGKNMFRKTGIHGSKIVGKSVFEIFKDEPVFQKQVQRAMKGETFSDIFAVKSKYHFKVIYNPFIDENKEFAGFLAMGVDITERINNENKLSDLSEMQSRLISIIGHDLTSPIGNIINLSELLLEYLPDNLDDQSKKIVTLLNQSGRAGHEILVSMLNWYRSLNEDFVISPKNLNLNELVSSAVDQIGPQAELKEISINVANHKTCLVFADKEMIITVLRNILNNAIKFTSAGGKITINNEILNDNVRISIADTGIGMSKELMNSVFKIRMDTNTKTLGTAGEKGIGLGLQICNNLIAKNGGKIEVESQIGKGSIFTVQIPKTEIKNINGIGSSFKNVLTAK